MRTTRLVIVSGLLALLAGGCSGEPASVDYASEDECADAPTIGQFDPATDLFLAHFDIKTDVDDLHSAAAVSTVMNSPEFRCVRYFAVAGTYGIQEGDFVPAPMLFDLAFGDRWRDAHGDRTTALADVAAAAKATVNAGGDVWVMEGGQSDFTADVVRELTDSVDAETMRTHVHVIQHSDWNEEVTSEQDLSYVKASTDYRKIPDGNAEGNGTPGYRIDDGLLWQQLEADERTAEVWGEARRVADEFNGVGYENTSVRLGGFDFSDTVEAMHVFELEELETPEQFFEYFLDVTW